MSRCKLYISIALVALFAGCSAQKDEPGQEPTKAPLDKAKDPVKKDQPAPNNPASSGGKAAVTLKHPRDKSPIALTLTLPTGWKESKDYGPGTFEPDKQPDPKYYMTVAVTAECNGNCAAEEMAKNVEAARKSHRLRSEQPNINSGDPERDAVRAQVEAVEDAAMPGGWMTILRVDYDKELLAKGPYKPHVTVRCYYYGEGRDYFVQVAGKMPLAAEKNHLADVRSLCKSVALPASK